MFVHIAGQPLFSASTYLHCHLLVVDRDFACEKIGADCRFVACAEFLVDLRIDRAVSFMLSPPPFPLLLRIMREACCLTEQGNKIRSLYSTTAYCFFFAS
jgi:hypothetical protein